MNKNDLIEAIEEAIAVKNPEEGVAGFLSKLGEDFFDLDMEKEGELLILIAQVVDGGTDDY